MSTEPELHVHLWPAGEVPGDPIDVDATCTGIYDDHVQFGSKLPSGEHLEIRLFFNDLPTLVQMVAEYQASHPA